VETRLSLAAAAGALDWSAPWYSPWEQPGSQACRALLAGEPVHRALQAAAAQCAAPAPVRFVPQSDLPPGEPYEQHIFRTRDCPTRDNLHDFFNGLVWLAFPLSKSRLNALQAEQIRQQGVGAVRGPVRDAITVFDENGALLDAPRPLWDALVARQWQRLFVELRPLWREARLLVFGHALLEKLAAPRKDLTAHVWKLPAQLGSLGAGDAWLQARLDAATLASKPFTPLPLLGVPGWCPANENFSFYEDSEVFRPGPRGVAQCA
jgi:hypothetical protein